MKPGQKIEVRVIRVDTEERKIGLSFVHADFEENEKPRPRRPRQARRARRRRAARGPRPGGGRARGGRAGERKSAADPTAAGEREPRRPGREPRRGAARRPLACACARVRRRAARRRAARRASAVRRADARSSAASSPRFAPAFDELAAAIDARRRRAARAVLLDGVLRARAATGDALSARRGLRAHPRRARAGARARPARSAVPCRGRAGAGGPRVALVLVARHGLDEPLRACASRRPMLRRCCRPASIAATASSSARRARAASTSSRELELPPGDAMRVALWASSRSTPARRWPCARRFELELLAGELRARRARACPRRRAAPCGRRRWCAWRPTCRSEPVEPARARALRRRAAARRAARRCSSAPCASRPRARAAEALDLAGRRASRA